MALNCGREAGVSSGLLMEISGNLGINNLYYRMGGLDQTFNRITIYNWRAP
jgi:hypothetical protein